MNKTLKNVLCAGAVSMSLLSAPAMAQVEVVIGPPPAFRATAEPVYYEGHAAYWYGGHWMYRDGREWHHYREEPTYLHDWRVRREPVRAFYGREHFGGYREHGEYRHR